MFKFAFNINESDYNDTAKSSDKNEEHEQTESSTGFECIELTLPPELRKGISINPDNLHVFTPTRDIQVEYINCLMLPKEDLSREVLSAECDHSDLIPGKYEGGLKVWECTFDLGKAMVDPDRYRNLFRNSVVLDLGCGSGILGILAIKLGASKAVFQDYNRDVLDTITTKNYALNCCDEGLEPDQVGLPAEACFYSGDWSSFAAKVDLEYDVILTSETIYNTKSYEKLISLFKSRLKANGVILLAAKTYYFGVGGGMRLFEKALDVDNQLSYRTAWECESGVKREILEIRRKTTAAK